jgi:hypothetical protein
MMTTLPLPRVFGKKEENEPVLSAGNLKSVGNVTCHFSNKDILLKYCDYFGPYAETPNIIDCV